MRSILPVTLLVLATSCLHAQELSRGAYRLKVEELRAEESSTQLTLTGSSGEMLYQIRRELPFDVPRPQVHLFSYGIVLVLDGFGGVVERYGDNGRMMERIVLDGEVRPNHERTVQKSGNDSLVALLISEPEKSTSRLLVLRSDGSKVLDLPMAGEFALSLELSTSGSMIAAGMYSWEGSSLTFQTSFVGIDGTAISNIDHEFVGGAWGLRDSLFLMYGRKDAAIVDPMTGRIQAEMELGPNTVVHGVLWDDAAPLIAASPMPRFESGEWIYSRLVVIDLADKSTVYQSESRPFRKLKFEKSHGGISLRIDGQTISLDSTSGKN